MSFLTKGRDFHVSKASDRLRHPSTSCSRVQDTPSAGVKRTGLEVVHIPSGADEVKKEWSYSSTPPHVPTWRAQGHLCPTVFLSVILNNVRQHNYFITQCNYIGYTFRLPVPVAARSKMYVWDRSPAEIVGSNPAGDMDVCLFVVSIVCFQVKVSAMSRSLVQRSPTDCDESLCVIKKPLKWGSHGPRWAAAPQAKKTCFDYWSVIFRPILSIESQMLRTHWDSIVFTFMEIHKN